MKSTRPLTPGREVEAGSSYVHPDKSWVDKDALSGGYVISNLSINSKGHPTDWSVRKMTPGDIGAEPAFSKREAFNSHFGFSTGSVLRGSEYERWLIANISGNYTIKSPATAAERKPLGYYVVNSSSTDFITLDRNNSNSWFDIINDTNSSVSMLLTSGVDEYGRTYETIIDSVDSSLSIPPKSKATLISMGIFIDGNGKYWYRWIMSVNKAGSSDGGGSTFTPVRGTVIVTTNITLSAALHDQKTLLCRNSSSDITITVPSGLGKDFDCGFISEDSGTRFTQIVGGTGTTLKAPHGNKLLSGYSAHLIKRTDQEIFNLQGELTP